MPARIGKGTSNRFGNLLTSTEKLNHETYDMNDEECTSTDHTGSNHNSAEVSLSMSPDDPSDMSRTFKSSFLPVRVTKAAAGTSSQTQTQTRAVGSRLDSHNDDSAGHKISSDQDSVASKVSWSDSDGSTYESEHYQQENGSLRSINSKDNLGASFLHNENASASKPMIANNLVVSGPAKVKGSGAIPHELQLDSSGSPRLEYVDYYSFVDVASTNDGLSSVGFISKEDTRPIFCRRIVPLEIPVQRNTFHDDVSAFSSCDPPSVMPTGTSTGSISVQAVHTRRATVQPTREAAHSPPITMLDKLDYISNIEVVSHNHDISTITCRVSCQTAASALNDKQHRDGQVQLVGRTTEPLDGPLTSEHMACHNRIDSISTLGSASVTSVASEARRSSFDADEDTGSSTKSTPTKAVKPLGITLTSEREISPFSHTQMSSVSPDRHLEHSTQTQIQRQNQATTNQRIKNLKEKIKQMQVASTMENLPDTRKLLPTLTESSETTTKSTKSTSHNVGTTITNQDGIQSRGQRHSPKLNARKQLPPSRLHAISRETDVQRRFQTHDQDLSVSILRNILNSESTLSHDKRGEVPSVVTPVAQDADDISTIHCDVGYSGSKDFVDVELDGTVNGPKHTVPPQLGQTVIRIADRSFREFTKTTNSLARHANTLLERCVGYHSVKVGIAALWMKYVHERSRTEQAIVGVILLSFSILFILVISLISG